MTRPELKVKFLLTVRLDVSKLSFWIVFTSKLLRTKLLILALPVICRFWLSNKPLLIVKFDTTSALLTILLLLSVSVTKF